MVTLADGATAGRATGQGAPSAEATTGGEAPSASPPVVAASLRWLGCAAGAGRGQLTVSTLATVTAEVAGIRHVQADQTISNAHATCTAVKKMACG